MDEVHSNIETMLTSIAMHDPTKVCKQKKNKRKKQNKAKNRRLVSKGSTKWKIGGFK